MLDKLIIWLFAIIFVEAITEIISTSDIFHRFRNFLVKKSQFIGDLIQCGYCLSVWASALVGWVLPGKIFQSFYSADMCFYIDCAIKIFVLHRLSNIFHEGVSRWIGRYPWVLSVSNTADVDNDEISIEDNEIIEDDDG